MRAPGLSRICPGHNAEIIVTLMGVLEGNNIFFLVLFALVVSGALRVGIEVHEQDLKTRYSKLGKPCETNRGLEPTLSRAREPEARRLQVPLPETPSIKTGILGPSWDLPPQLAGPFSKHPTLNPKEFQLHIKLLTFDRPESLQRCFDSLESAFYDGDTVSLDVFVDHGFNEERDKWGRRSRDLVHKIHGVLDLVDSLAWSHGPKRVHYRSRNGGIQPQWLESWWPESLNDFATVVEDDMQLSPLYYRYLKLALTQYYYNATNYNPQVYGISFQRQFFVAGEGGRLIQTHEVPFLYQLVGTWGQTLFPLPWKSFRLWYDACRYNASRDPGLGGMKTTHWWHNKGNRLWTPWIIKWAHARHMYNLYPSFPGKKALSVSHREAGSNFKVTRGTDADLIQAADAEGEEAAWAHLPSMAALKRHDFCFRPVPHHPLAHTLEEVHALLQAFPLEGAVTLTMVPRGPLDLVNNWLCHLEGVGGPGPVMVVLDEAQGAQLAAGGRKVVHLHLPSDVVQQWEGRQEGENVWPHAFLVLVQRVLAQGRRVLICNPDTVWHGNPWDAFGVGGKWDAQGVLHGEHITDSLLLLDNSVAMLGAWGGVVKRWGSRTLVPTTKLSLSLVALLTDSGISFRSVATAPFRSILDANLSRTQVPVVMGSPGTRKGEKIARMAHARLWIIDDFDLACKAVTCKKQPLRFSH